MRLSGDVLADNAIKWLISLDASHNAAIALGVHFVDAHWIPGTHVNSCFLIVVMERA